MSENEKKLRESGARNLREFGYPDATPENVTTVWLFGQFFKRMLEETADKFPSFKPACESLLAEIESIPEPA